MKLTDNPNGMQQDFDQEGLLHRMTNGIRQSLELQQILAATVTEVRSFLGTDRVKVYRFDADGSGEVVAESIYEQRLPSLLGLHFPADDIPLNAREMFLRVRQRSIVDVPNGRIGVSPLESQDIGELNSNNIQYRPVNPCHIEYLKAMGVKSSLVMPILHYDLKEQSRNCQLWGLLVSHHSKPRTISNQELKIVQHVADQVTIAIAQSNLLRQESAKQQREALINKVTTLLHTLPTIELLPALQQTVAALDGVGGRLYIQHGEVYTWGDQPTQPQELECVIEEHPVWQNLMAECKNGSLWAVTDLYQEPAWRVLSPAFRSTRIRGLLVMRLSYRQNFIGYLSIFRNEFDTEILWAGQRDSREQQLLPRISFAAWREQIKGQARGWSLEETELFQTLCHQFSMAIQQQEMYQQVQMLNLDLEARVKKQTAELQKSLQLASVLRQVTDQIRSTLELKTILQTIVREICQLLNTDRVIIYQIFDNSEGEIIFEQVNGNWQSVLGMKTPPECVPDEYANLYLRGRIRAINNVCATSLTPCHRDFLQNIQVQANLIVPIKMGTQLWGLLIAHQCNAPRNWQDAEINLIQQLADQAAIAIQQAQLYEQSRTAEAEAKNKATQLEHTLEELQQTQAQLIQTEKMSSLGQLVAGIAHEINNPVNFIYGNLSHCVTYTHQLLELLRLYQLNYPQPNYEIDSKAEEIELAFLTDDLLNIMSSMKVGSERIRSIVLSLRNFARLDEAEMKRVDLHEGINNTLLILQHRLKPNQAFPGIEVIKNYSNLPLVECYAGQINQVFMNILTNAIDAFEDSQHPTPQIRIRTEMISSKEVLICIADNGHGITEDIKKRIFDPFFTTKPVGKGTGLGLAISYQIIVQKHGGIIKCISEPGKGTEICMEIPLKQTAFYSQLLY